MKSADLRPFGKVGRQDSAAVSKDGYLFNPSDAYWRLNKDVQLSLALPVAVMPVVEAGYRATLLRYAEEASAKHCENMSTRFKRYLRDTAASQVSVADLINWRVVLGVHEEWQLGGLKGFLLAWHDYGFGGVSKDVVDLLRGWRMGSTPISRTVLKELQPSDPAWRPFAASLGCGVARCSQTHPLLLHPVSGSSFDRLAHA